MTFSNLYNLWNDFRNGVDNIHHTDVVNAITDYAKNNDVSIQQVLIQLHSHIPF